MISRTITRVDQTSNLNDFLRLAQENQYTHYFMDLNLGKPNSEDITPALHLYEIIKSRVDAGKAKFYGRSGNLLAVSRARELGWTASTTSEGLIDFIRSGYYYELLISDYALLI